MTSAALVLIDSATGLLLGTARSICEARRKAGGDTCDLFLVDDTGRCAIERGDLRPLRLATHLGRLEPDRHRSR